MADRGLSDFLTFSGTLSSGCQSTAVTFRARIDESGEVALEFDPIPRTQTTRFIDALWDRDDGSICEFELVGETAEGIKFKTDSLHFTTTGASCSPSTGAVYEPRGRCETAEFHRRLIEPAPEPFLRVYLRGFENFDLLYMKCPLGLVAMSGAVEPSDSNILCGRIELRGEDVTDYVTWKAKAEELVEHIRRIMSFAASTVLQDPVMEHYVGNDLYVTATSKNHQARGQIRTFHFLDQEEIFRTAVETFFKPVIEVRNLYLVIEWFSLHTTYKEVRLVNAMTALEMLLDSNLGTDGAFVQESKQFERRTRPFLRRMIRRCLRDLPQDKQEQITRDMNEKLGDINRQTFLRKLETLGALWSVPFDGITAEMLKNAKRARDHIVHRGQYYDGDPTQEDLWYHVSVIREVVVRFVLKALGHRGRYISHLGGYHDATFPPPSNVLKDQ